MPEPQDSVGAVYQPRLDIMCEAYQTYCAGARTSLNLLQHLHEYPDFHQFVKVNYDLGLQLCLKLKCVQNFKCFTVMSKYFSDIAIGTVAQTSHCTLYYFMYSTWAPLDQY